VKRTESGLTIVELLVAMAILGVLLSVIVGPITSLFQITNNSNRQLAGTAQAQRIIERFKSVRRAGFDRNCVTLLTGETSAALLSTSVTAQVQYLNADASVDTARGTASLVANTDCLTAGAADSPVATLKRLTLSIIQGSQTSARVVIDIPRPLN
jgi:prepilin-type N-terminal cleavage/methylation domain-containing protein